MRVRPPIRTRRRVAATVAAITLVAAGLAGTDTAAARPFGPLSPWNIVLPANAPLQPNSQGMVADLVRQVNERTPWVNTTKWSVPVYTVPADQPTVRVKVDIPGADNAWNNPMFTNVTDAFALQTEFDAVPIPPDAHPSDGTDHHLVVWQPSTDTAWEFWEARDVPRDQLPWNDPTPGWHAMWGARVDHVSTSDGANPAPYGATASGLALLGGLVRISELEAGHIDHALGVAITQPERGVFVPPATRTDGAYDGPNAIPEGTRFRLDPNLDVNSLHLPPVTRMFALAAQRYGLIVRDTAGNIVIYGEDPYPTGSNPYPQLFGGLTPDQIMRAFPWNRLQAITPDAKPVATPSPSHPKPKPKPRRHHPKPHRHHHRRPHPRRPSPASRSYA